MKYILAVIQAYSTYQKRIQYIFTWIARFGYMLFLLYGIIEWLRPGAVQERLYRRRTLLYCLFSVAAGSGISWIIGHIWYRRRPFVRHPDCLPLIPHKDNASFPSNHSMNAMAASLMLLSRKNGWGIPFLIWSVVLGSSRIICRLHYFSDVIGGFILGALSTAIIRQSRTAKQAATNILWITDGMAEWFRQWRQRW